MLTAASPVACHCRYHARTGRRVHVLGLAGFTRLLGREAQVALEAVDSAGCPKHRPAPSAARRSPPPRPARPVDRAASALPGRLDDDPALLAHLVAEEDRLENDELLEEFELAPYVEAARQEALQHSRRRTGSPR